MSKQIVEDSAVAIRAVMRITDILEMLTPAQCERAKNLIRHLLGEEENDRD